MYRGECRVPMTRKPSPLLTLVSLIGMASFLYPFFLPAVAGVGARSARGGIEVPLVFTARRVVGQRPGR